MDRRQRLKSYISLFKKEYDLFEYKHYRLILLRYNKFRVEVKLAEDSEKNKLHITLEFDNNDNVSTIMDLDDPAFYKGIFYKEVIETKRDNEAWQIIKKKYSKNQWKKKNNFFLFKVPIGNVGRKK